MPGSSIECDENITHKYKRQMPYLLQISVNFLHGFAQVHSAVHVLGIFIQFFANKVVPDAGNKTLYGLARHFLRMFMVNTAFHSFMNESTDI